MPTILHILSALKVGGAEMALHNLLNGGLCADFDNQIVALSSEGAMRERFCKLGISVSTLGMDGHPSLSGLFRLRDIIRRLQPDLIQGWMYHGNLAASLACSMAEKRVGLIWNIRHSLAEISHEKISTRQIIRLNRFFSGSPSTILYNSKISRQQHESFGFKGNNGQVIPNGIDLVRFRFSDNFRQRIRDELAIPSDSLVVGHVARHHPMKDHPNFLQAAMSITTRHPDTHFILIGRDVSLDNSDLACLIPENLRHQFHLLGERPDVHELMSAMDLASSSSYGEAFPNVVGEAMAASLPCVVTDVGDSAYIVGETGVVIPPRDSDALATGIESLLALPPLERQKLGEKARQRIESNFALAAIVKQYSTLYETIINEKRNNT